MNEQAEQAEQRLLQEYKHKLLVEDDVLPDPFSLHTGWQGEKTAIHKWPSVYLVDIAKYLNNETHKEIFDRLLNEYKEGQAQATSITNGCRKCFTMRYGQTVTSVY